MAQELQRRRRALGVSTTELANRLNVCQSTVVRLEQSEKRQTITLASLERVARHLAAQLVYRLEPLDESSQHTRSLLGDTLRREVFERRRTPIARLKEALELSDTARKLCMKKP